MPGLASGHLAPRGQVVDADLRGAAARQEARALRVQRHAQQLAALRQRCHRVARRVVPELRARAPARLTQRLHTYTALRMATRSHAELPTLASTILASKASLHVNLDAHATWTNLHVARDVCTHNK